MRNSSIIMYTTEDGLTKIETTFDEDTVWLSIDQMAELFQRDRSVIGKHVRNIFKEGELQKESVWAKFAYTAADGKKYNVDYYNLDVIISVGYRVKSRRGTQFRIWAMGILKEYMKKGFALDDDRLKRLGGGNYFDELLARIRDIRSSEKVFWRKVLEIYATSIDYDPHAESSVLFFKQVQNKMHWAAHKHTAAEVIYERADAEKENMGLTSWEHNEIRRSDVEVAKNYLTEQELDALNKIVTAYLDIAEVHALNKEPMYMKDWLETIDDYLKMTRRDILTSSGHISHKQAIEKAHAEYDKYKNRLDDTLSPVEKDFIESIGMLEQITDSSKKQHFLFYILTPAYQRQQQRDEDELKYRKERFEREKRDAEYYRDRAGAGYEDARGGDGLFTTAVEKRKNAGKDLDTANWHAQQASYEEQRIADLERKLGKQMRYKWI